MACRTEVFASAPTWSLGPAVIANMSKFPVFCQTTLRPALARELICWLVMPYSPKLMSPFCSSDGTLPLVIRMSTVLK